MGTDVGMPDGIQLALIDIGFQAFDVFLNVLLFMAQQVLATFFTGIFDIVSAFIPAA